MLVQRAVGLAQHSVLTAEARDDLFGPSRKALRRHRRSRGLPSWRLVARLRNDSMGYADPYDFSDISFRCVVRTMSLAFQMRLACGTRFSNPFL